MTGARARLESGGWDAVVLQQGPSSLPESRAHLRRWSARWAGLARRVGARPALLTVWPEADRASSFAAVVASYAAAARAADALLLPAGDAWRRALARDPGLELYGADGFHPSELGTSLAALVVHAGLTGAALPPARELGGLGDARTAETLRASAAAALAAAR